MPLQAGTRLGPYEVVALLGAGGMGEVYRARDMTLKREVALKVLPERAARDPERFARFTREAQTLGALNHPNIAHIHGIEERGGVRALVMEFVEGEDLAQRLRRGAVLLDEALPMARQIAQALEAAHEHGIIHRDLKPANIKVRNDGTVKVLDFGLAKVLAGEVGGSPSAPAPLANSPTFTSPAMMTEAGAILGTAAYMSPEQARGGAADKRSDVWAFGCVLYEMLTGTRAFRASSVSETLALLLTTEPDWTALPAETPAPLARLIRRCLAKDRRRRLADIADAGLELDDLQRHGDEPARRPEPPRPLRWLWPVAAAISIVSAAVLAILFVTRATPPAPEMRVEIASQPTTDPISLAISPDGRSIAFVGTSEGRLRLWIRSLHSGLAWPVSGTDGASLPFWSPDSHSLGFFADGKLKRTDDRARSVQILANAAGKGGAWSRDGTIVFASANAAALLRMPAAGGEATPLTRLEAHQLGHSSPQFLPDDRHFLYYARGAAAVRGIYVGEIGRPTGKRIHEADSAALYALGHLFFARGSTLLAQPFDAEQLEVKGEPFTVAEPVVVDGGRGPVGVSTSRTGPLVYRRGSIASLRQFTWYDGSGRELQRLGAPENAERMQNPSLSRDSTRVALYRRVEENVDIWILELSRGVLSRVTFDPSDDVMPVWSPDRQHIVFSSNRKTGVHDLYLKSLVSSDPEQLLFASPQFKHATDWSQDGRFVLFRSHDAESDWDIWALPVSGTRKPFPVVHTPFDERDAQLSPDGRWIAYQSNESGRFEVYVQPFPGPGVKTIVSASGGAQARWRPDGEQLFYVALDGRLMGVPIRLGDSVQASQPRPMFQTQVGGAVQGNYMHQYMVADNGARFLMNVIPADSVEAPMILVLNWAGATRP